MRWRFVDRIGEFEPWSAISGRKAVSLEEYFLLDPMGRQGVLPETLVLESCVDLVRWLVARSSEFRKTCVLRDVAEFTFQEPVRMGQALDLTIVVRRRDEDGLGADCRVHIGAAQVAEGALEVGFLALADAMDPEETSTLWQELYAST